MLTARARSPKSRAACGRRNTREDGPRERPDSGAPPVIGSTHMLLADVLVQLVDTRCLRALEICKLSTVCVALRLATQNDALWQQLLFCAFPNCAKLPRAVLEKRGHRWIYMQRSRSKPPQQPPPPPPPPKISPSDLQLLIDVYLSDEHIASVAVQGEELAELLQDSSVTVELPKWCRVGNFAPNFCASEADDAESDAENESVPEIDVHEHRAAGL